MKHCKIIDINPQRPIRIQLFGKGWLNHYDTSQSALPSVFWPMVGLVATAADQRISPTKLAGELWPEPRWGSPMPK